MRTYTEMIRKLKSELEEGLLKVGNSQSPFVRRLASTYAKEYLQKWPSYLIPSCKELMKSRNTWQQMIACAWLSDRFASLKATEFDIFEQWLHQYIFSWGTCDDFCKRVLNPFWEADYGLFPRIRKWTRAQGKWVRRASAVIFIKSEGGGYVVTIPTKYVFEISDRLMNDLDMHIQQGFGWMLKAASVHYQREVYDYVMKNRDRMPRTAFRYAIEKMPEKLRRKAMQA